ncbi:MAG: DnaJ domain-containing protein, partial [Pseudomonadota bacterium]
AAAIWLLARIARDGATGGEGRNVMILRAVVFLGLVAVLMAAKLWPLAFMTLLAAAAITGIELWRARAMETDQAATPPAAVKTAMKAEEAASVLGIDPDADEDAIKSAHKKLIGQLHPDKGGTDYLAAQINDARATLLAKARERSQALADDDLSEEAAPD